MAATEWEKKERDEVKSIESTVFTCARVKQNFKSLLVDNCICYFINWAKRTKNQVKKNLMLSKLNLFVEHRERSSIETEKIVCRNNVVIMLTYNVYEVTLLYTF